MPWPPPQPSPMSMVSRCTPTQICVTAPPARWSTSNHCGNYSTLTVTPNSRSGALKSVYLLAKDTSPTTKPPGSCAKALRPGMNWHTPTNSARCFGTPCATAATLAAKEHSGYSRTKETPKAPAKLSKSCSRNTTSSPPGHLPERSSSAKAFPACPCPCALGCNGPY